MNRIKGVRQHDTRDCGAACLATICMFHGLKMPLVRVRELCRVDKGGSSLYALVSAAKELNLKADALTGSWDELRTALYEKEIDLPLIAHVIVNESLEHYVVLNKVTKDKVLLFDPARGNVSLSVDDFKGIWTGFVLAFALDDQFVPANVKKGSYSKFIGIFAKQKHLLLMVFFLSLVVSGISIVVSFAYQSVIDGFIIPSGSKTSTGVINELLSLFGLQATNIALLFVVLLCLVLLQIVLSVGRSVALASLSKRIDFCFMETFLTKTLRLPIRFFHDRKTGEILSRFGDIGQVREAVSNACLSASLDLLMIVVVSVVLFDINRSLFFITIGVSIIYLIVVLIFLPKITSLNRKLMEADAQLTSTMKESVDGIETVKALCAEEKIWSKLKRRVQQLIGFAYRLEILSSVLAACVGTIESIGMLLTLMFGASLVLDGKLTLGTLIAFESLAGYFTSSIKNIATNQPQLQAAYVAVDRLNDVLEASPEKQGTASCAHCGGEEGNGRSYSIEFNGVSFSYGYRKSVIHDVSFGIERGKKVALVGESGCGKTTLVRLLMKFYEVDEGNVFLDGQNVASMANDVLRKKVAYVSQDTFFFSDTVRANLTLNEGETPDPKIWEVLELCMVDEVVRGLAFGLDTILDEEAGNLSGGQRQRLAIARALLLNPEIIIFDEATSNLDAITEQAILRTFFEDEVDRTMIIIAHRLKSLRRCDSIVVMNEGRVVEKGTHEELMACKGYYAKVINV